MRPLWSPPKQRLPLGLALLLAACPLLLAACGQLNDPGFIAYTTGPVGDRDIGVVRPDGSQSRVIVNHSLDDFAPRWSADQKRIAFLSNRDGNVELYVTPADGSSVMRVTDTGVAESQPTWAPDGQQLAYVSPDFTGNPHVYLMTLSDLTPRRLTYGTAGEKDPAWSPNGQWIAFVGLEEDGTPIGIFLRNPKGVNRLRLTHNLDYAPAWSSDSKRLTYISEHDGNQEIYMISVGGEDQFPEPVRLTEDPDRDYAPAWSPSGKRIAFLSDRGGNTGIYGISSNGEDLRPLTKNEVNERALVWGPNGDMAFISEQEGKPALFVMSRDGERQLRVLNDGEVRTLPDW